LHHATASVKRAVDPRIFQNGNIGIPSHALKFGSAAKNTVIPEREPEDLYAGIPERIAHAIHEWARRKAQAETSARDARVGQDAFDLEW